MDMKKKTVAIAATMPRLGAVLSNSVHFLAVIKVVAIMLMPFAAYAGEWTDDNGNEWTYILTNGSAKVCSVASEATDISIPVALGGKSVGAIDTSAFSECTALKTVMFPNQDGMLVFWQGAFKSGLEVVMEPEYGYAFRGWVDSDGNSVNPVSFTNDFVSVRAEFAPVVVVKDVSFRQRYPWNGMVDIDFTVDYIDPRTNITISVSARDGESGKSLAVRNVWLENDATHTNALAVISGSYRLVWDAGRDNFGFVGSNVTVSVRGVLPGETGVVSASGNDGDVRVYGNASDYFLGNDFFEIGINKYGALGSITGAPTSGDIVFNPYYGYSLSLVSLIFSGTRDFFLPAYENERWSLSVNGSSVASGSQRGGCSGIYSGEIENHSTGDYVDISVVNRCSSQMKVEHVVEFNSDNYGFLMTVRLTNESDVDKANVRYIRLYDPDQNNSSYSTDNYYYKDASGNVYVYAFANNTGVSSGLDSDVLRKAIVDAGRCPYVMVGIKSPEYSIEAISGGSSISSYNWHSYTDDTEMGLQFTIPLIPAGGTVELRYIGTTDKYVNLTESSPDGGYGLSFISGVESSNTGFIDLDEGVQIAKATEVIAYSPKWGGADVCVVDVDGVVSITNNAEGVVEWIPEGAGVHTLTHTAGDTIYTAQFTVLGEDVLIHVGALSSNEVWSADKVHLVTSAVTVPGGVSLVIEPGAVVKFMSGTSLAVASGGSCTALGVIFTHVNDDAIGGDTLYDGEATQPTMGDFTITGSIADDDTTEYRYMPPQTLAGSITSSMRLRGYRTYIVSNSVTVAGSATLTLLPGTIIKFNSGCSLIVNGTLNAQGTRAAPIVFTSLKDDAHGGDTNVDGDRTSPDADDWRSIKISGTANISFANILYGGGTSSSSDSGVLVGNSGGKITLANTTIAHAMYDGIFSRATVTGENLIIHDCDRGINTCGGSGVFKNCVIDRCRWGVMAEGGSGTYYNCIITRFYGSSAWPTGWGVAYWSGSLKTYNCCVYSSLSGASNYRSSPTAVNNVIADPLFVDADNMDFRIAENSPCVDAGDGTVAPKADHYGQPRMDVKSARNSGRPDDYGICPDIGIYEVPGVAAVPLPDLAVVGGVDIDVAEGTVAPGDTITLTYVVTNRGKAVANGLVRDLFRFKGVDASLGGITADALEIGQSYNVATGACVTMTATITVPTLKTGNWKIGVEVNPSRDVFEQNLANNSAWSEDSISVEMSSIGVGSQSVTVNKGEASGFILPALSLSGGVVRVTGANGMITAYGGNGTVPTGSGGALGNISPVSIALADGSLLVTFPARAEGENAYLVLENSGSSAATVSVEVKEAELAIFDSTPERIANMGEATITITGSGLVGLANVSFGGRTAKSVEVLNAAQIAATFDVEGMSAATYDIVVSDSEGTIATQAKAVEVYAVKMGPRLRAWLEMPSSVRDGRVFAGYVCYANDGDSPMTMPVFKVARQDSSTKLGLVASENMTETSLYVGGISPTHPAGVLKAGDEARIPFYFQPFGTYRIKLTHIKDSEDMVAYPTFGGTKAYLAAMSAAATRLNLRGRTAYNIHDFVDQALWERNGIACAAASGYLVDAKTGEPLANADISLVGTGDSTNLPPATATTDENGYFQLTNLADGEYRWLLDSGNTLAVSSTNVMTVADQTDLNGLTVHATPGGRISGFVLTNTGEPVAYGTVARLDEGGSLIDAVETDGFGAFAFNGLSDGTYSVRAMPYDGYMADTVTNIDIDAAARSVEVTFAQEKGAALSGMVTYNGVAVTNGIVEAITSAGEAIQTPCSTNGVYQFGGIAPNRYALRYYSALLETDDVWLDVAAGNEIVRDLTASVRPLFEPSHGMDFDSCTTTFYFTDPERAKHITAWAWDFDSDGVVDSREETPSWTYSKIGTNTVTLTIEEATGKTTSVYRNCVIVEKKLPTILAKGAIVFGENSGTLKTESMSDGSLTLTGDPESGNIEVGNVIMGQFDGDWYCRRIAGVSRADGKWHLSTAEAEFDDVYDQCTLVATGTGNVGSPTPVGKSLKSSAGRPASGTSGNWKVFADGGIDGDLALHPDIHFDFIRKKVNGVTFNRIAFRGMMRIEATIGVQGTAGVKKENEFDIPFSITIPTPIPGVTHDIDWKAYTEVSASIKGSGSLNGTLDTTLRLGCQWFSGQDVSWDKPFDCNAGGSAAGDFEGSLEAKIGIKPSFKGKVLKTLSAGFALNGYIGASVRAAAHSPAEAAISAGLAAEGTINLIDWKWLDVGTSVQLGLWKYDFLKWTSPDPDFSRHPAGQLEEPASVNFVNESKPGEVKFFGKKTPIPIRGYQWDLGNGICSGAVNPNTTYSKGKYTVYLKALPSQGIAGPYRKKMTFKVGEKDDDGDEETDDTEQDTGKKSWDPNEMVGDAGIGEARLVRPGQVLTYTIYFENKEGFDIADAQDVKVTNPLSEWLDWSTFEMCEAAFNNQNDNSLVGLAKGSRDIKINGSDKYVRASVGGGIDGEGDIAETGIAHWRLRVYDPNGLLGWPNDGSGFLPSNDATHRGEGHITYRIRVREDAPANVVITNSASIVFDYNDPIETDPAWWNTVGTPSVDFVASNTSADEGGSAVVHVKGGNAYSECSVKLYLVYNTAAAADVDLAKGKVDGVTPKGGLKFPLTLKWAKGEIGEKTITIPIKTDTLLEGDEFFTLQLAAASGMELGTDRICTVRIADAQERVLPAGATAVTDASGEVVGYFTKKNAKGNTTAKAMPGYVFTGWFTASGTKAYSTKATIADKTRKSMKLSPRFALARYVRALADPANGGTVTGGGTYADGKTVTFKATPKKNWSFEGWGVWDVNGQDASSADAGESIATVISTVTSLKVKATNDVTYVAMFKPYPKVTVAVDGAKGGTVSGAGSYLAGKTATLKATPKKGYAFCGWYDADGNRVSLATTYKYKMAEEGAALTAVFKKESALARPVLAYDDGSVVVSTQAANGISVSNILVGVSYSATLKVSGESKVAIASVTGLPKGLSYKSGKITGVPSARDKSYTAKVTVALSSNTAKKWTYKIAMRTASLPAWASGKFTGEGTIGGKAASVTLSVGSTGKISGKFVDSAKVQRSFTASSFKAYDNGVLSANGTMTLGKKKYAVDIVIEEAEAEDESGVYVSTGAAEIVVGDGYGEATLAK